MRYRALDSNGDYSFGSNSQDFLQQTDAVAQAILTRLKLLQAEWWEDLKDGLPLWQEIIGFRKDKNLVDKIVIDRILGTTNVRSMLEYESYWDNETREYTFTAKVDTVFGDVILSEVKF